MSTTRIQWILTASRALQQAGVDSPRLSAELLLLHVCGISRIQLAIYPEKPVTSDQAAILAALLQRRSAGEPIAYILGVKEFFGRDFAVTPATLIPRPETELLVEKALELLATSKIVNFADLGTGSGCIAVTLCAEKSTWFGTMVDVSKAALAVAEQNARSHGVLPRLHTVLGDFCQPLFPPASLDLIVSNPPYISEIEYPDLSPEIRFYEPYTALVPCGTQDPLSPEGITKTISQACGEEGIAHLQAIAAQAALALRPGGLLLMEHGWTQRQTLHKLLLKSHNWESIQFFKDLSGKDRLVAAFSRHAVQTNCCQNHTDQKSPT